MAIPNQQPARTQSGIVLLICLIMLLLLTIIGITGMQTSALEEKMTGNMRDRSIAFQAAEAALRDAELDIVSRCPSCGKVDCGASTTANSADDGICDYQTGVNAWETDGIMVAAPSVAYGALTGKAAIAGNLSAQPRYLIEKFSPFKSNPCQPRRNPSEPYCYRITARGQGLNPNTAVQLQEFFK